MELYKNRHFLQSKEWNCFQKALHNTTVYEQKKDWSYLAYQENSKNSLLKSNIKRIYCPYGPFANNLSAFQESLLNLENYSKNNKIDYIRIDLFTNNQDYINICNSLGYVKQQRTALPVLTGIIDLSVDENILLQNFSKTNRRAWRKTQDRGIIIKKTYLSEDIGPFNLLMSGTSTRTGAKFHDDNYHNTLIKKLGPKKNIGLLYALNNSDDYLATIMFYDDFVNKIRYYLFAGNNNAGRKIEASNSLMTYAILDAKQQGMAYVDLFGLSEKDQDNHKWAGFSKFKRSFGCVDYYFGGTWEKPINKLTYKQLLLVRKISKLIN